MIRDVDLISYLPQFIQEYREIKHIMNAENPEFQTIEDVSEAIKNNQFILTCDENGISRFEQLLNIVPNNNDTLNVRISRVLARWNDTIPYTYSSLIEKLKIICGDGNYQIVPNFKEYEMELIVNLPLSGQVEELDYMLSYMIPANIVVKSRNVLRHKIEGKVVLGGTTIETNLFTLNSKINMKQMSDGSLTVTKNVVERIIN